MAPSAVTPPQRHQNQPQQDIDLTAAALELTEAASANGHGNGHDHGTGEAPLDASLLTRTLTMKPRAVPVDEAAAHAGDETVATDHMVTAAWRSGAGWAAPELKPYGPLSLMPTASVLHYATECFEGLKVFRGYDGRLRIFRPDRNAARMRMSAARISLPVFDPAQLERLMLELLAVDGPRWLPRDRPGAFLYLRPTLIGTQPQLGVQVSRQALLYVILTFMPRLDAPAGGMRLHTSPGDMVRAWVGGFGYAKLGANYGPSLLATQDARRRGFHQILWLYDPAATRAECTEAGASNFFVVWRRPEDGRRELLTAPLDDKLILDGVTRRSCLDLARQRLADEDLVVTERKYTIAELLCADAEGRILEAFAAGTAYFICPVSLIHHRDRDIHIPIGPGDELGDVTGKLKRWIGDIMYGREDHPWGVVIEEKE
ncbi:amino-transferase class IV domain-containing protein [Hirsutella rhossiliensis]|uniref:Branched-chain-amino-acid aminotransferase n=1 Tax=Hirsutella rhossiliensis TaxID=111463 RepID=A0A9P8MN76_9HYPO|nr:amino-transferase class IV domain-containing protein [Hirsutella rhossiliensis]KAH0958170.1 amino-transferase class IV domain-containing protein [Hirsutella rhossiliensis]